MTNADIIRSMRDEELAEWINTKNMCEQCANYYEPDSECMGEPCASNILRWLRSEAKQERKKMAIKPILFNTKMVRAILEGRKSCTRRLVKFLSGENPRWTGYIKDELMLYNGKNEPCIRKAPYQPGDILYARETWKKAPNGYYYYEDWQRNDIADVTKWHPSIHMPKEAARIWLKVTNVRVEQLQEITIDGIRNEGLSSMAVHAGDMEIAMEEWKNLWNSTVKKSDINRYGWDANPWVWVIEFEQCEKPKEEN